MQQNLGINEKRKFQLCPLFSLLFEWHKAELWKVIVKVEKGAIISQFCIFFCQDIATYSCSVKSDANPYEVCGNVDWACNSQNYADVSAQCTWELTSCCNSPASCDSNTLHSKENLRTLSFPVTYFAQDSSNDYKFARNISDLHSPIMFEEVQN